MKSRMLIVAFTALVGLSQIAALAGPISDAEARLRSVYALYRSALFTTNQKDQSAARRDLEAFSGQWRSLAQAWESSPPPQYADDAKLPATLKSVTATLAAADGKIAQGDLAGAHEVLEKVRDELAALRARNGVTSFSDQMNAYHEAMEHVLQKFVSASAQFDIGELREQAAVLEYLATRMSVNAPPAAGESPQFQSGLKDVQASVAALVAAARAGDRDQVRKALEGLKRPYSLFFLKFG